MRVTERLGRLFGIVLLGLWLSACSTNPVTGNRELMIISEAQEFSIGREQYEPAQQAQGGLYYLDPELTLYVQEVGNKLAKVSDRPDLPYEFVVLNNSVPNAWALPSGKIAINRGLLIELEDEAQLAAVLGHEIVHAAARHSAKRMQSGLLVSAGIAGLGLALQDHDHQALIIGGAALGANLTMAKYGRNHELESDHYGMKYMARANYDPQAAVELQKTFVRLSEGRDSSWLAGLFASHPPSQERVDANKQHAKHLTGGYRGKEAYQKAIKRLTKTREAYEAADKGYAVLKKGDAKEALKLANRALKIEKDEALFYALRGEANEALGNDKAAMKDFDKAVALNPTYWANYLNRGLAQKQAGNNKQAEADLQKANSLLPTSTATLSLAGLAEQRGDTQAAMAHYRAASAAVGEPGRQAQQSLARLDLPENPQNYLPTRFIKDQQGRQYLQVTNQSPVTLRSVSLEVVVYNGEGWEMYSEPHVIRNLAAGESSQPRLSRLASAQAGQADRKVITRVTGYVAQ